MPRVDEATGLEKVKHFADCVDVAAVLEPLARVRLADRVRPVCEPRLDNVVADALVPLRRLGDRAGEVQRVARALLVRDLVQAERPFRDRLVVRQVWLVIVLHGHLARHRRWCCWCGRRGWCCGSRLGLCGRLVANCCPAVVAVVPVVAARHALGDRECLDRKPLGRRHHSNDRRRRGLGVTATDVEVVLILVVIAVLVALAVVTVVVVRAVTIAVVCTARAVCGAADRDGHAAARARDDVLQGDDVGACRALRAASFLLLRGLLARGVLGAKFAHLGRDRQLAAQGQLPRVVLDLQRVARADQP
eukprot:Unigene11611_Nuclearia_a/m.35382 Unigene11611_Nuclearia_a/g.35382  ORF Unigene11611_Nuclearia_a/g.35382 Unigene11611_Nuclearia_a/m.35382 type:complete len:305 (+) Unigene11611_Nuclearia_a:715-1629(+)